MKKFLYNIGLFFLIVFLFYAVLLGRYIIKMRSYGFELPKEKTVLVIGDSQTQADIDDEILPNVKNVSLAHDQYFTFYQRLKLYIEDNPQIDTVILALTPHTLSPVNDNFFTHFGYVQDATRFYLPFMELEEWKVLISHDAPDVLSTLVTPTLFYWVVREDFIHDMGHFEVHDRRNLESDIKSGAVRLVPSLQQENVNDVTVEYAHKIVDYCKLKNIKLIGINTPVYNGECYFDMDNYHKLLKEDFPDIELWDDMNFPIPDSCRRDVNHLNRDGATLYSNVLKKRLNL